MRGVGEVEVKLGDLFHVKKDNKFFKKLFYLLNYFNVLIF